jgi:hypothetical protein
MLRKVRTFAISSAVAGLVMLASSCGEQAAPAPKVEPASSQIKIQPEEERPPIVVSSGSIDLFIDWSRDPSQYSRGEWKPEIGSLRVWHHAYPSSTTLNYKLKEFRVHVLNGKNLGQTKGCDDPDKAFIGKVLKITYRGSSTDYEIMMEIDPAKDQLKTTLPEDANQHGKPWLSVDQPGRTIREMYLDGQTCEFSPGAKKRGVITVRQVVK